MKCKQKLLRNGYNQHQEPGFRYSFLIAFTTILTENISMTKSHNLITCLHKKIFISHDGLACLKKNLYCRNDPKI